MPKKQNDLQATLSGLMEFEATDFPDIKEAIKNRDEKRKKLKAMLESRENLPDDSEIYAGLVKTNGRILWKDVAEELAIKHNVQDSEYSSLKQECTKPSYRLKYGFIKDAGKKLEQMEFEFITPARLA